MPKSKTRKTSSQKTRPARKQDVPRSSVGQAGHKAIPGGWTIAKQSFNVLIMQNRLVIRLILLAWVVSLLIAGVVHTTYYSDLSQSTEDVSGGLAPGVAKTSVEIMALTVSLLTGAANSQLTEAQQLYAALGYVLLWLVLIWLLRHIFNDATVRLRDGLYNAAAPLIPTLGLVIVALLQLVPLALLVSIFASISVGGVVVGVWWTMMCIVLTLLAAAATLYWLVGTVFALVMVTIPGTYPLAALKSAKAIVTGYRRQLVGSLAWLLCIVVVAQLVLLVLLVTFDAVFGYRFPWLVASLYQLVTVATYVYAGTYMYVLYRRLIDARS